MAEIQIFWDPQGIALDSLGNKRLQRITDGDTPYVEMGIRMLSIDTPEVHYPGNSNPARYDEKLAELGHWLEQGQAPVSDELAAHLQPRLASGSAGTLQRSQGDAATDHFQALLDERLTKPSGRKRSVYLHTGDEPFDQYGRLLAYMAPAYSSEERAAMSPMERATFNLLMVDSGWAAPFPIYPSLPRYRDLVLLQNCARTACETGRGAWAAPLMLTGYEFRMCVRMWEITRQLVAGKTLSGNERGSWATRYCVDMTTRAIHEPGDYLRVAPYNRIFIWPKDVQAAVGRLNLLPG